MASKLNSNAEQQVPAELIATHQAGWRAFVRFTVINCVALAAFLLLMLLFFKVIY